MIRSRVLLKKCTIIFILCSLFLTVFTNISSAAVKAGSACTKLNSTTTSGGYKYTCIKSGKKLVWSNGIKVTTTTLNPAPIKNFNELTTRYKDIKYWAWKNAADAAAKLPLEGPEIVTLVGPNTKNCYTKTESSIQRISQVFRGSNLPKKLWILNADKIDKSWIELKTSELLLPHQRLFIDGVEANPHGINNAKEAVEWINDSCQDTSVMGKSGGAVAHGFTHGIQKLQFMDTEQSYGNLPRWLFEGTATFSENFIAYGSDYKTWISNPTFHNQDLKKYDLKFYKDYLLLKKIEGNNNLWAYTDQWPNQRAYDLGSYVVEVFIAIKGPASVIDLYTDFAKVGDFDKSFKNIYGITWSEAEPLVAQSIYQSISWLLDPNTKY